VWCKLPPSYVVADGATPPDDDTDYDPEVLA
jgi:hypothetical protein